MVFSVGFFFTENEYLEKQNEHFIVCEYHGPYNRTTVNMKGIGFCYECVFSLLISPINNKLFLSESK
jgi:hypothetical protein